MKRILISKVKNYVGEKIKIAGWVEIIRSQGKIQFLVLRDISGKIQIIIAKSDLLYEVNNLTLESVIEVTGLIKLEKQAPGGIEMEVEFLNVLSLSDSILPMPVFDKGGEVNQNTRLNFRWLDLRKPGRNLIFQVWTTMEQAWCNYCSENNFIRIHSPKLMNTASESGAELFSVNYFEEQAYLAQSSQFFKQMAMASGFEKVFEFGPVFRAEHSFTSRHGTEFTQYDFEISFIDSHKDVMMEEEKIIISMLAAVEKKHGLMIEEVFKKKVIVPTQPFPQLTLAEVKKILKDLNIKSEKEGDLSPEEEREISKYILTKHNHEFVFITEYPKETRAFYHMRFDDRPNITKSFDLLYNGVEITTGAQREHRYQNLRQQALDHGLELESLEHYLNFFKYGCPPHGGIGFGVARFLMSTLDLNNIRDVTYLYRGVNRLSP